MLKKIIYFIDSDKSLEYHSSIIKRIILENSNLSKNDILLNLCLLNQSLSDIEKCINMMGNIYELAHKSVMTLDEDFFFKVKFNVLLFKLYKSIDDFVSRLDPIDVIYIPQYFVSIFDHFNSNIHFNIIQLEGGLIKNRDNAIDSILQQKELYVPTYEQVFTGGYFDYLHNGHKMFLSVGALLSDKYYLVTVLEPNTIGKMKEKEHLMQRLDIRSKNVKDFLTLFHPYHNSIDVIENKRCLDIKKCPLTSKECGKNSAILVISETESNGEKLNQIRNDFNLDSLLVYKVREINCPVSNTTDNSKLSSTFIRSKIKD